MRRVYGLAAVLIAGGLAGFGWQADASRPGLHRVVEDVVFDLAMTPDGLTACLDTVKGAKLSGQYGVKVTALSAAEGWDETMPKTVAVEQDYFQLPLRIDLKRKPGGAGSGKIHFEAAACLSGGMCVPIDASFDTAATAAAPASPCRS